MMLRRGVEAVLEGRRDTDLRMRISVSVVWIIWMDERRAKTRPETRRNSAGGHGMPGRC